MHEREAQAAELPLAEVLLHRDRAWDIVLAVFRGVDPRRHHERLLSTFGRQADALPDLRQLIRGTEVGRDRLAAHGQLVDHRNVEVAIDRLAQGLRDRRRGREQEVRIGPAALFAERRTLSHPEAVLLVDDGEREALERNVFFDERMRPDNDVERALGEPGQDRPARVTGHTRGEERVGGSAISE